MPLSHPVLVFVVTSVLRATLKHMDAAPQGTPMDPYGLLAVDSLYSASLNTAAPGGSAGELDLLWS